MYRWIETFSSGNSNFITLAALNNNFVLFGERRKVMSIYSLVGFFQRGGFFMYPILIVLATGLSIAFERWVHLKRVRTENQKIWDELYPVMAKGEFDKAREMANKDKSNMAQMLGMGLARQGAVRRREDIEIAMEESMMEIIPQLEKRTPYLALLSNIATLFGLLGTITGLIEAFATVATASPAEKAALLSVSISVAMNCTAFGLGSAIPLLLLHAKLTTTTGQIVNNLEMASVKALNAISNFSKRQFDRSPALAGANVTGVDHAETTS
jgi:biopolymer transport protein ExbB